MEKITTLNRNNLKSSYEKTNFTRVGKKEMYIGTNYCDNKEIVFLKSYKTLVALKVDNVVYILGKYSTTTSIHQTLFIRMCNPEKVERLSRIDEIVQETIKW